MKDKKNIVIFILLLFIILAIVYLLAFNNKKNTITFTLNGEDNITIEYGSTFIDPGFVAKDGYGNDLTNYVKVNGEIDTFSPSTYKITYELNYNENNEKLIRVVVVKQVNINDLKIVLNGDDNLYLIKNSTYHDPGVSVINTIDNKEFLSGELSTEGNVDTSNVGVYNINYVLNYDGKTISANRKVTVFYIGYSISPEEITTNKVKIILDLSTVDNYSYTKLPNDSKVLNKNVEFEASSNGLYTFTVVLKNKDEYKKEVKISNIIENYKCSGTITNSGTRITVSPTTGDIKNYEWVIGNKTTTGNNVYSEYKIINSAKVNVVFNNGEKYSVNCLVEDKLPYHFKYDENNTKPFMRCDTYTDQDKIKYEAILKQVVEEAGYGTRAGVVAAARFIVGGLDYKVPYQGSSKYNKQGLNIGQKNAWGCSSIGLDCYYFVYWALSQNGLPLGSLYAGTKYKTADEKDKIKIGDYLLTPCNTTTCKNDFKINHIGIVIGIDNDNIYVAEATTLSINALVVTKLSKSNLPKSGNLSLVKHVDYEKEGNINNMWISE